jgi:hypothetical protein
MELFKKIKKHVICLVCCVFGVGQVGCSTFKKDIGLEKTGADPFVVHPLSALEVPPEFQELPSDKPVHPDVLQRQKNNIPLREPEVGQNEKEEAEQRFLDRMKSQGLPFF